MRRTCLTLVAVSTLVVGLAVMQAADKADPRQDQASSLHKLPKSTRITRAASMATLNPSSRQYRVKCSCIFKNMTIPLPPIVLRDGEKVTISDKELRSFVIATKTENGNLTPITCEVQDGTEVQITVMGVNDTTAFLDVEGIFRTPVPTSTKYGQSIRMEILHGKMIECAALNELVTGKFGSGDQEWRIEAAVEAMSD